MKKHNENNSQKVFGYIRVSSDTQVELGKSLQTQKEQIEGYAKSKNLTISKFYEEKGNSAYKIDSVDREEFSKMFDEISDGDIIIATKLDRVFRRVIDAKQTAEKLKKLNVHLHLIDLGGDVIGNGISGFFFTILSAFAEFESDMKSTRIKEVKQSMKQKNEFIGGRREKGFSVRTIRGKRRLVANEREYEILKYLLELRNKREQEKIKSGRTRVEIYSYEGIYNRLIKKFSGDSKDDSGNLINDLLYKKTSKSGKNLKKFSNTTLNRLFKDGVLESKIQRIEELKDKYEYVETSSKTYRLKK